MSAAVLQGLTFAEAGKLARLSAASIGRARWDPGSCLVLAAKEDRLVLVSRGAYYMWEPHSVDLRRADWLAVLPLADA